MSVTEHPSILHAREVVRTAAPDFQSELAKAYLAVVTAQVERVAKREEQATSGGAK